jgi:hypothetical protein
MSCFQSYRSVIQGTVQGYLMELANFNRKWCFSATARVGADAFVRPAEAKRGVSARDAIP